MTNDTLYDYSDNYFKYKNPNPHNDFPTPNDENIYKDRQSIEHPEFYIPQEGVEIKSSLMDLADFYESMARTPDNLPDLRILIKLASQIYSIARNYALKPDDPDDHGFGKDCEKFCIEYEYVVKTGKKLTRQQLGYLVKELDSVISGCHANESSYSTFFEGSETDGWNMLEAKFTWNGKGSLWEHYYKNWKDKKPVDRKHFPNRP
jgi:hypothetical protein